MKYSDISKNADSVLKMLLSSKSKREGHEPFQFC